ncbi:MAG TPA: AraC family transcriptional regulator [Candidatus Limiplasma sp.]|nr:AraC family transcriptional regulator [Candidatus Limiplasma sp.]
MEWLERLNSALDYIEEHLADDIQTNEAARIACCSTYHFQRMFSYIAGVPLAEYIRRRRMTMAAFALQQSDVRVIDLALRFGYDSPTAFNRAFQSVHGMPPTAAKEAGVTLHTYPRISFHISIKGDAKMDYRIEDKGALRIIGLKTGMDKDMEKNFRTIPKFWLETAQSEAMQKLRTMMDTPLKGVLGVSACAGAEEWEYYIAVASTLPLLKEFPQMCEYTVPAGTWAVFPGTGVMPGAIQALEKRVVTEWLPTSGYEYANAPDIEVYLTADPQNTVFEVWLPIVKKNA